MARDALYTRLSNTATRLINKYDQGSVDYMVEVVSQPVDPYDPPVVTLCPRPIKLVARGVSAALLSADPDLVSTDLMIIIDGQQEYKPAIGDKLSVNGNAKVVVRVDRVPAAGDPVIFKFFVR